MSGALEKQVAGARAFTELDPEAQAALEALPPAARNALFYDGWEPTAAQRIDASRSELVSLVELVHAARPDVVAAVRFNADSARVTFRDGDARLVLVGGFDRLGHADIEVLAAADSVVLALEEG